MHDKPIGAGDDSHDRSNAEQDRHDQGMVLAHLVEEYPGQLRLSDLVRELTEDSGDFAERDGIERAVGELVRVGLLFRSQGLVLPTRAALRCRALGED